MLDKYYNILCKFINTLNYVGIVNTTELNKLYLIHLVISMLGSTYAKDEFTDNEMELINRIVDTIESDCGCFKIDGFIQYINLWQTGEYNGDNFMIQYINDNDFTGLYNALILQNETV